MKVFFFFLFEIISRAKSYYLHGKCLVKLKGRSTIQMKRLLIRQDSPTVQAPFMYVRPLDPQIMGGIDVQSFYSA